MEPSAVTIQERSEIAPTFAMLVGSMMMPEPIMLTATTSVSCIIVIFFAPLAISLSYFLTHNTWYTPSCSSAPSITPEKPGKFFSRFSIILR